MPPSKVELYAAIRRDARAGMSGRAVEKKYRVGRRTIVKALASAWPGPRKGMMPRGSKLDAFKPVIDEILKTDLDAPRKQRHTVTRIYRRLIDEHGMDDVSYPVVRAYVAERKPQVWAEAGRGPAEVFLRQSHRPGDEAEVDFGEVVVRLAGQEVRCYLFCLRLSFSGKAVHRVSLSGGQEAFLEGHEHAFRVLGGVPAGKVRYDNLKAAVAQVIGFSRARVEVDRWTAFRSHSLLTELPALSSQFTGQIPRELATVSARVRLQEVGSGSRGAGGAAGGRAGGDRQPLGAVPAA
jgi:transposase